MEKANVSSHIHIKDPSKNVKSLYTHDIIDLRNDFMSKCLMLRKGRVFGIISIQLLFTAIISVIFK